MIYLVTGGTGFIGSHLVDKLLKEGNEVIVVDNNYSGRDKNLVQHKDNEKLIVYKKSICEDLNDVFKNKIDAVFHLAAIASVQFSIDNPTETHNVNVNGTFNLLNTCRRFGIKRFIFSSSSAIYGDQKKLPTNEDAKPNPISPYALHKLIGEYYCKLFTTIYGMETISLRYFNVFGPRQNPEGDYACLIPKFIKLIRQNKTPIINGDGKQTRDFVHVSDVVEANVLAAKTENKRCFGEAFNIGSGKNISVNEVTETILNLSKKNIKPIHGPAVIEPRHTMADIKKAKTLLDWEPKTNFEDGFKETYEYFKD